MNQAAQELEVGGARRLKITEIFYSLQGEADTVGFPTVFVRLTGCPLRCQFCDTAYAFHGGEWRSLDEVLARVGEYSPRYVCVTGGEPLAQKNCLPLLTSLCDANYRVSLETSGAMPLADVDARVIRVVDVKTPGSGEERRNRYDDLALLRPEEQIKFVICDRADYEWSLRAGRIAAASPRAARCCSRRARSNCRHGNSPTGSSPIACRCGSSCNFTRCCGAMSRESNPSVRAVVLLSGGLDSATVLAMARAAGLECYALSVAYGQRHAVELDAAAAIARRLGAHEHRVMHVDLANIGGSALTDASLAVPTESSAGIPITYVPARNTIMLSLALAWAEVLKAGEIHIGVNAVDYSGYPDCRPQFVTAFEQLAQLATKVGVEGAALRVHAPLIHMSKAQIVREGVRLGVDYSLTVSCYQADAQGLRLRPL